MRRLFPLTFTLALCAFTAEARADDLVEPAARQGYFIGGGWRLALSGMNASKRGDLGAMTGFGGAFRFGEMATDWLGFGLVFGGGNVANADWTGGYGGLLLEAQLKPLRDYDLAVRVGVGIGGMGVDRVDPKKKLDGDPTGNVASMYTLALAWDWFPFWDKAKGSRSGGFAVTPYIQAEALPTTTLTAYAVILGIEGTWWSGLPDHKLDLPADEAFKRR